MILIDTNIAVYLRDVEAEITARVATLSSRPKISLLTLVELESGIYTDLNRSSARRVRQAAMLRNVEVVPFDADIVTAYGDIVAARGFSRTKIIDRLIAATAIVHRMTLITINAADFRDIPGLTLESWPAPSQ